MLKRQSDNNYYKLIPPILICIGLGILLIYFIFSMKGFTLIWNALGTVITAFIMIYLLKPIVDFFEKYLPIKRGLSIVFAILLVIIIIALMLVLIIPGLVDSISSFVKDVPDYMDSLEKTSMEALNFLSSQFDMQGIITKIEESLTSYMSTLINLGGNLIGSIAVGATSAVSVFLNFLIAIFMAWYALLDAEAMTDYTKRIVRAILPTKSAEYVIRVTRITDKAFKDFLVSKLLTCVVLGFLVYIGIIVANLFGLDIPYAPLFGLIIGLTNIIPYIGPIIGTVPCLIIALLTGWPEAVALLCIVLIMQQVDNIYISPKILGDSLGVKPFWVVASVAIGGSLFGTVGMVLSVPVVAVIQILLLEFIEGQEVKRAKKLAINLDEPPVNIKDEDDHQE